MILAPVLLAFSAPYPVAASTRPASACIAEDLAAQLARFRLGDTSGFRELTAVGEPAVDGLVEILCGEKLDVVTRFMAANVLGDIRNARAVMPLIEALRDPAFNVRRCSALALGKIRDERARVPLRELAEKDPFVYRDPESGKDLYLVRIDALTALDMLDGKTAGDNGGAVKEAEIFLDDATKLPRSPVRVPVVRLPFPFPGKFVDQNVFNNYQQPTDGYIHAGLDILQSAGTEVRAVEDGWVAAIATNYPEWKTHHFFVVAKAKDGNEGWCYTHVDPDSYAFRVGDRVKRGTVLGKLVDFSVGANEGVDHLHLHYVRFAKKDDGTVDVKSLVDPLAFFDYADTTAPTVHAPVRFVKARTLDEFPSTKDTSTVSGDVDVIAGISDNADGNTGCNWMVPVVTLEIRGEGSRPWRKLVLDQRGEVGDEKAASALYLKYEDAQRWREGLPPFPGVNFVIATHTDGDGSLERADALQCWETAAVDKGVRRFPDGNYEVTVRAFDLKGNMGVRTARVRVQNP